MSYYFYRRRMSRRFLPKQFAPKIQNDKLAFEFWILSSRWRYKIMMMDEDACHIFGESNYLITELVPYERLFWRQNLSRVTGVANQTRVTERSRRVSHIYDLCLILNLGINSNQIFSFLTLSLHFQNHLLRSSPSSFLQLTP